MLRGKLVKDAQRKWFLSHILQPTPVKKERKEKKVKSNWKRKRINENKNIKSSEKRQS